ncbi:tRNA synthetases class II-domain-containing protein [Chytriomyces sp. MP71]|nr:tRNA synthetases class II-domain-containing protein [Chytriomyces sp. MP71]
MHRICTANSRFGPRGIHIRSPTPCHFVVCHAAVRHGSLSRSVAKQLESASAGIPVSSTSLGSDTVTAPSANLVNTVNSANWANAGQDEAMDAASARISVASTSERVGQRVTIAGWLSRPRRSGALLAFAAVRDWTGSAQVVVASPGLIDAFLALSPESVVTLSGFVRERPTKDARGGIDNLEIALDSFHVINAADPLPFETHPKALMPGAVARPNEETMLKYRYIELRQPWLAKNLQTRSRASFAIRSLLHSEGFMEVETPCLFKSTPEGAREFLVPTRQKGFFFALPQSPQQFKQVLMAGGVEKYYQFARCFRDESIGSDRQQEFTQVDMELSFVTQSDIMTLIERLVRLHDGFWHIASIHTQFLRFAASGTTLWEQK